MVITADTRNSRGSYIDAGLGLNLYGQQGCLKNMRLGVKLSKSVYQDKNGVQLKRKEVVVVGLQYAF